jgi:pyrroloquinoline quinone (PQQ) biosynthesis protein C
MTLFERMQQSLSLEKDYLFSSPIIRDAMTGNVTREQYVAYLTQAYFHVRETVPLLMACGSRLSPEKEWLRSAVAHYIDDEYGHEQWILDDIRNAGFDPESAVSKGPSLATEFMVAYAWDTIQRRNPVGFFGMVYVLETTSIELATAAADSLATHLELPPTAFRYLSSHGSIDLKHVRFLEGLIDRLVDPQDQEAVLHCASRIYCLYAQLFRTLPDSESASKLATLSAVA